MPSNEVLTFILIQSLLYIGLGFFESRRRNLSAFCLIFAPSTSLFSVRLITPITFIVRIKSFDPKTENDRGDQTGSGPGDVE